jgi:hypothetical protein
MQEQGKFVAARRHFARCASAVCPLAVFEECSKLAQVMSAAIPSVVVAARDPEGNELTNVRVEVDGKPFISRLDGRARELDTGEHAFRFIRADGVAREEKLVLREGEKQRLIEVTLGDPKPGLAAGIPPASWVLGGVGALGLIGFGFFAIRGTNQESDLDACSPRCPKEDTDRVKETFLIADISLAIGLGALAAATVIAFSTNPAPGRERAAVRFGLGAAPAVGGGVGTLSGRF